MNYFWLAFEILLNIVYGFIWCIYPVIYFGFKDKFKSKYLILSIFSFLLFTIITGFNYFIIYEGFLSVIYVISIFMFTTIFLKGNVWEKILISVIEVMLLAGIAVIVSLSVSLMFEEYFMNIIVIGFNIYRLIHIVLSLIIYLLILKLILYLKKELYGMKKSQWLILLSTPIISLILIISIMEIILMITNNRSYSIFLIISIISIIILNMLIYIFMGILNKNNKMITQYKLENQQRLYEERNIDNIKNMYESMKELKHDMKQHTDGIVSRMTDMPNMDKFQNKYIGDIISYISRVNNSMDTIKVVIDTKNRSIDSLLNYKISVASENNIKIETVIDTNIPDISDVDLCCVIGNLLDNAIEACGRENIEDKLIVLHMTTRNSCLMIRVKNSILESVISTNPTFKTTKQDKEIHGIGLKSIKSITEKYSGFFKISEKENKFFIAEVLLVAKYE